MKPNHGMFDKREYNLLKKYKDGRIIESEDRRKLRRMSSIGLVTLGYTIENDEALETAGLTSKGKRYLKTEDKIRNSIVSRAVDRTHAFWKALWTAIWS